MSDWRDTPDEHLDPSVAANYDANDSDELEQASIDAAVDVLTELAGDGRAVEFAIGTGRIGLPLSGRGVDVEGIDFSEPMLEHLHNKPGADRIHTTVGDMTTTVVGEDFTLAYLVYNTIMNLRTQEAQVACFANAARHLRPGGRFVVEVMVPRLRGLDSQETVRPFHLTPNHLGFDEYVDLADQIVVSHHIHIDDGRARRTAAAFRYVWPAELDLMAQLAGLALEHRWSSWDRTPFNSESAGHVSVWRKPDLT